MQIFLYFFADFIIMEMSLSQEKKVDLKFPDYEIH